MERCEQPVGSGPYAVDRSSGRLLGAHQRHSPNQDARPPLEVPSLVVLHGISLPPGQFATGAVDALFTNQLGDASHPDLQAVASLRVSAHLFIERQGRVTQYVPLTRRAWHAGQSSHFGRAACNDFSIGIELEGTDTQAYENAQYDTLTMVLTALFVAWPHTLSARRLAGHSHIAPGRKTDPGEAFDWERLLGLIGEHTALPPAVEAGVACY